MTDAELEAIQARCDIDTHLERMIGKLVRDRRALLAELGRLRTENEQLKSMPQRGAEPTTSDRTAKIKGNE